MTPTASELLHSVDFAAERIDGQLTYIITIINKKNKGTISVERYDMLFSCAYDILWDWQLHYLDLVKTKP